MNSNQRSYTFIFAIASVMLIFALLTTKTQGQFAVSDSPFKDSKVRINFQNLNEQQIFSVANEALQNRLTPFGVSAKASEVQMPAGLKLVALVDNHCAEEARASKRLGELTANSVRREETHEDLEVQAYSFELGADRSLRDLSLAAEEDDCIVGVVEDVIVRINANYNDDPKASLQGHLTALRAAEANQFFWGSSFAIKQDVIIGVIDTGIDYNHEDLSSRMWTNGSGHRGFDFVSNDTNPMDDHGHGTHVGGLAAAASSNQIGVSGIFGFRGKLMAVKAMDAEGSGSISAIVNSINWAVQNGAQVINMSLGAPGANAAMETALRNGVNAGVIMLAAAGNDGQQLTASNIQAPASYGMGIAGLLSIGSFDGVTGQRSSFSNYSTTYVELGAPGSESGTAGLASTYPTALGGSYARMQGTSMASPVAAGAAALALGILKSNGITTTPAEIERIMVNSALKSSALASAFKEGNRLDLVALGRYLQSGYLFEGAAGFEEVQ